MLKGSELIDGSLVQGEKVELLGRYIYKGLELVTDTVYSGCIKETNALLYLDSDTYLNIINMIINNMVIRQWVDNYILDIYIYFCI